MGAVGAGSEEAAREGPNTESERAAPGQYELDWVGAVTD